MSENHRDRRVPIAILVAVGLIVILIMLMEWLPLFSGIPATGPPASGITLENIAVKNLHIPTDVGIVGGKIYVVGLSSEPGVSIVIVGLGDGRVDTRSLESFPTLIGYSSLGFLEPRFLGDMVVVPALLSNGLDSELWIGVYGVDWELEASVTLGSGASPRVFVMGNRIIAVVDGNVSILRLVDGDLVVERSFYFGVSPISVYPVGDGLLVRVMSLYPYDEIYIVDETGKKFLTRIDGAVRFGVAGDYFIAVTRYDSGLKVVVYNIVENKTVFEYPIQGGDTPVVDILPLGASDGKIFFTVIYADESSEVQFIDLEALSPTVGILPNPFEEVVIMRNMIHVGGDHYLLVGQRFSNTYLALVKMPGGEVLDTDVISGSYNLVGMAEGNGEVYVVLYKVGTGSSSIVLVRL